MYLKKIVCTKALCMIKKIKEKVLRCNVSMLIKMQMILANKAVLTIAFNQMSTMN